MDSIAISFAQAVQSVAQEDHVEELYKPADDNDDKDDDKDKHDDKEGEDSKPNQDDDASDALPEDDDT
ncbi:hypothetical protein ACH5RR_012661 [Cinchona calisaya]|uniref:Uncharacterized protein n=1 Tax=Cinchona calisaya TaxID=153742 RepID=A0ABD3A888_9GENT